MPPERLGREPVSRPPALAGRRARHSTWGVTLRISVEDAIPHLSELGLPRGKTMTSLAPSHHNRDDRNPMVVREL